MGGRYGELVSDPVSIPPRAPAFACVVWLLAALASTCVRSAPPADTRRSAADVDAALRAQASVCPATPVPSERAPGTEPHHETAAFWLPRLDPRSGQIVLNAADVASLAERVAQTPGAQRDVTQPEIGQRPRIAAELEERRHWLRNKVATGSYQQGQRNTLESAFERIAESEDVDRLHVVAREAPLWCIPTRDGLYSRPVDLAFDRNQCASIHAGEGVRVLLAHPREPWLYVHTGHSVGWLRAPNLGPVLDQGRFRGHRDPNRRLVVVLDRSAPRDPIGSLVSASPVDIDVPARFRLGTNFPLLDTSAAGFLVESPGTRGPIPLMLPRSDLVALGPLPFRPADVMRIALDHVGQRYGWGGRHGDYDCSRFLYDLFAVFGVPLARHSSVQARLGSRTEAIDTLDETGKREAIRAASREGIVLLYMTGHIMLYLGEDGENMYAISAISEYLEPCRPGHDTVRRLDRVAVTTLELGRGTARTAFIERLARLAVFGTASATASASTGIPPTQ